MKSLKIYLSYLFLLEKSTSNSILYIFKVLHKIQYLLYTILDIKSENFDMKYYLLVIMTPSRTIYGHCYPSFKRG